MVASSHVDLDLVGDSDSTAAHDRFDAIIIGGGQAGLSTAGWCKSYGLRYVVIERNDEIGQNWTRRYDSAKLHTGHRFNDLPFGPTFTDEDPEWLTTGALAQGYRKYVKRFGINVWTSTTLVEPAKFDSDSQRWTVRVQKDGKEYTLSGRALVLGNGLGGAVPEKPDYPGEDDYQGVSIHSGLYRNSNAFAGKKGIVVGSANTGHDVAEDMLKAQLGEITMVQRGATYVVPREHFKVLFDQIWNYQIPQELSDRFFWSTPTGVSRLMTNAWFHPLAAAEPERWEALEKSGFNVDIQGDFVDHLLVRFGGHYMDCGVSKEIADGHIKVKSNSPIKRYTQSGLEFADGATIDADLIVWCTGFKKEISQSVVPVLGEETAKRLKTYLPQWGVDNQGDLNGAFVPSGVENCWLVGGGCSHARYFTRFVALQVQADKLGHPMTALYD